MDSSSWADGGVLTFTGPGHPSVPGVTPPVGQLLRRRKVLTSVPVWWVGVHGGSGESTLAGLLPDITRASDHTWPSPADPNAPRCRVVLVARTSEAGLRAAQAAIVSWASGYADVDLAGLVLSADAPGKLPRPLREFANLVVGGLLGRKPWHLPWVDAWRLGDVSDYPRQVAALLADVGRLADTTP